MVNYITEFPDIGQYIYIPSMRTQYSLGYHKGGYHSTGLAIPKRKNEFLNIERQMREGLNNIDSPLEKVYWQGYYDAMNNSGFNHGNILYARSPNPFTMEYDSDKVPKGTVIVYLYGRHFADIWKDTQTWTLTQITHTMNFPIHPAHTYYHTPEEVFTYIVQWFFENMPGVVF